MNSPHPTSRRSPYPPKVAHLLCTLILLLTAASLALPAGAPPFASTPYWTDFRGPNRTGIYDEMPILTTWPSGGLRPLWRHRIGGGYASFVIANDLAFTIEQRGKSEVAVAYDVKTGNPVWADSWNADFRESMGGDGPRATPTWHDGHLYVLGALGEFRALNATTGQLLWSHNILKESGAKNIPWGMSASPLIVDDKVIVLPGGSWGSSVIAYDRLTGKMIWKSLDDQQAYTSPMLVTLAGVRQLLIVSASRVMGLRVEDGGLLWSHPWVTMYEVNATQPVLVTDDSFVLSAGYDHGSARFQVTRQSRPSKNPKDQDKWSVRQLWTSRDLKARFNSPVLYQDHIYGLDEGILACINSSTGKRTWKGGRYGYGQVLLASGHLIITTEAGDIALVKATPDAHTEIARFSSLTGRTWNNPAISGGILFVRNTQEMAAYDLRPR